MLKYRNDSKGETTGKKRSKDRDSSQTVIISPIVILSVYFADNGGTAENGRF